MDTRSKQEQIEIYRAYLESRSTDNYTINHVCKKMNVSRSNLYHIVRNIEKGNTKQLEKCLAISRANCVWEHIYKQRSLIIEDYTGRTQTLMLRALIHDMRKDGFGVREIGRYLAKEPALIEYYLRRK